MAAYQVKIRGEYDMPRTEPFQAWYEVDLPQCPDCGGNLIWWEAMYAPGTRKCMGQPDHYSKDDEPVYREENGCGSLFSVQTDDASNVFLRRERFY